MSADKDRNFPKAVAKTQAQHHSEQQTVLRQHQERSYTGEQSAPKRVERHRDVVSLNRSRSQRVRSIDVFGPVAMTSDILSEPGRDAIREAFVEQRRGSGKRSRKNENQKRGQRVTKSLSEHRRKLVAKERNEYSETGRLAAIDDTVRAADQVIQIIHQPLIANLFARDRKIGCRAPIEPSELLNFFAR